MFDPFIADCGLSRSYSHANAADALRYPDVALRLPNGHDVPTMRPADAEVRPLERNVPRSDHATDPYGNNARPTKSH
jgi:hypothetical protein